MHMTVDSWDPAAGGEPTDLDIARLCRAAEALEAPEFGLSAHEIARLAPFARHQGDVDWERLAAGLEDDQVLGLIRLFTLAENVLPSWEAGARSPVVPLAGQLKKRGCYPDDLTRWIKANSSNRFLPHGSLMDRL
jgi:hypothetical protein